MSDTNLPVIQPSQILAPEEAEAVLSSPVFLSLIQTLKMQATWVSEKALIAFFREQALLPPEQEKDSGRVSQSTKWQNKVSKYLLAQYDIIYTVRAERLWARPKVTKVPSDYTYKPFYGDDLKQMVIGAFEEAFHRETTANEVVATAELLKLQVKGEQRIDFVDNTVVQISDNLFWDGGVGELQNIKRVMANHIDTGRPLPEISCFRRLFDTNRSSPQAVKWGEEDTAYWNSEKNEKYIMEVYFRALQHLNNSEGRLPIPFNENDENDENAMLYFDFIMDWADNDIDTYMDILRSFCSCFLKVKPKGSYFLIGPSRNGKSTMNDLLRTILGENNTEQLPMTKLGDWHFAKHLNNTLANLPDEDIVVDGESKEIAEIRVAFKTAATHGRRKVAKMAAEDPVVVYDDYMSFFPMNHMPNWGKGSGAEACNKRCWPIYFTHDFSKEDTATVNFAEKTFTPKRLAPLIGVVLALATYHSTHPLTMSPTMELRRGQIEDETASCKVYRELFLQHFNGFENKKLLFHDYKLFCQDRDIKYNARADFFTFVDVLLKPERYRVDKNGNKKPVWPKINIPGVGKAACYTFKSWSREKSRILHSQAVIEEVGQTVDEIHGQYNPNNDVYLGKSVLTAIAEAEEVSRSSVTPDPDQLPKSKPKSSEQYLKEYELNKKGELND